MPTTPAASPSSPSTKFTALTVATTMKPVSSAPCAGSRENWVPSGVGKKTYWMPEDDQEAGGEHLPAELGQRVELEEVVEHADRADQRAGDQHDARRRGTRTARCVERNGSSRATRYAATRPPSIARPPR